MLLIAEQKDRGINVSGYRTALAMATALWGWKSLWKEKNLLVLI
jgi:hypothetical protein